MKIGSTRGRVMASTMLCGALAIFAAPAYAQDAANSDTEVTEIVVTGSRLQRKDFVALYLMLIVPLSLLKFSALDLTCLAVRLSVARKISTLDDGCH